MRTCEKVQLALIWGWPRAFQRAIDEPYTLPLSPPKCGTKREFTVFASKIQLLSKQRLLQSFFVWKRRGKVVATSFLYLTVHRWIAGDVPIYLKFALKLTHPFKKRWFRQISLNSAAAIRASEKVILSLIGNRQCAFHRAIDEPCTLPLSLPKGGSKWYCLHLALPFISSLQVIIDISNLICGLNIASPSLQMTNPSLKWAWPILNL